jgi:hypothetical protein
MIGNADLSRAILLHIEEQTSHEGGLQSPFSIYGYDNATILAHTGLLIEGGYLEGKVISGLFGPFLAIVTKMTKRGHVALHAGERQKAVAARNK